MDDAAAFVTSDAGRRYAEFGAPPAALREARIRYAPGPEEEPASWESTETDQLGRKTLRSGDCYRVIQDDNVMRLDIYETFTRYIVFCDRASDPEAPIEMPEDFGRR